MAVKLAKAPLREILREQGGKNVSAEALEQFRIEVEAYAYDYATRAVAMMNHAGRKTLQKADVVIVRE